MVMMSSYLTLTQANIKHDSLQVSACMGVFPQDIVGGGNKSQLGRTVQVRYGSKIAETDIDGEKRIFRRRAWIGQFFRENQVIAGDRILVEQLAPYSYRVTKVREIMCLSIQQPWADLIFAEKKLVENRTWPWLEHRNWQVEGSVPLAIHASKSDSVWRSYTEPKREKLAPGWRPDDSEIGVVLGMVDVVQICQYKNLPQHLLGHMHVHRDSNNWCWVLDNPQRFPKPYPKKGNVFFKLRISGNSIEG